MTATARCGSRAPDGVKHFGIGVGSLVLIAESDSAGTVYLRLPLVPPPGGRNQGRAVWIRRRRKKAYDCVRCLNRGHMQWAWVSMFYVGFADLYMRLCAMGIWHDWRIF